MSQNKTYHITEQINWKLNEVRELIKDKFGVVHFDAYLRILVKLEQASSCI